MTERDIDASVRSVTPVDINGSDFARVPVWDPRVPFDIRLTPGHPVLLEGRGCEFAIDGFIAEDPDLDGYVILDFDGFDTWLEEDDPIISHPHSPFSRIDVRTTSKNLRLSLEGLHIARTTRARILFETGLVPRYYFPRVDVLVELEPSDTETSCAYKVVADYFSLVIPGPVTRDLARSYENPLIDGEQVRKYVCFFDEKLDLTVDGIEQPRPQTPWS